MTISDPGEWTREDLEDAWLRFGVGYYGGRLLGVTWKVNYTSGGALHHYTYTYEVNGNATIAVTIGGGSAQPVFYRKNNDSWTVLNVVTAYKKVNDSWVVQNDWTSIFNTTDNFKKGD